MTPQLSPELRQALARQPGRPLEVEDPLTHAKYVLVELDDFEQLQRTVDYDASDPDPRAFYPSFASAVKDDVDAPGMEAYDADLIPVADADGQADAWRDLGLQPGQKG